MPMVAAAEVLSRESWERQPGEPPRAYAAFEAFRQGRSMQEAAAAGRVHRNTATAWRSRWKWDDRLDAYEAEQDRLHRQEMRRQRRSSATRHLQQFRALQALGAQAMQQLDGQMTEVSADDAVKLVNAGVMGERKVLGADVEDAKTPQVTVNIDARQTVNELRALILSSPEAREHARALGIAMAVKPRVDGRVPDAKPA